MGNKTPEEIAAEEAATKADAEKAAKAKSDAEATKKKAKTVKVRALGPLGEIVDGEMKHFAKDEVFEVEQDRAKALGPHVKIL